MDYNYGWIVCLKVIFLPYFFREIKIKEIQIYFLKLFQVQHIDTTSTIGQNSQSAQPIFITSKKCKAKLLTTTIIFYIEFF